MTEATAAKATKTEYVVLEHIEIPGEIHDNGDSTPPTQAWVEIGSQEVNVKNDAIKALAGEREGIFKAVPMRSWKGGVRTAPRVVVGTEELDI